MWGNKKALSLFVLIVIAGGAFALAAYFYYGRSGSTSTTTLPSQCSRPQGGYLIVADFNGFNDSVDHGVPANSWPVIDVQRGSVVTITVCNVDSVAHGFQITHYLDSKLETLAPGSAQTFSFIASETGTFTIYCDIFCPIHWAMLSGALVVN